MDPTGTGLAIAYNKWRKVEVGGVHRCFEALPDGAFAGVKMGDVLWKVSEPYAHSAGKVYGYERIEVIGVRQTEQGTRVDYRGSVTSRMSTLRPHAFFRLSDAEGLAALVAEHGHKITRVHDPQYDRQLATAKTEFEATWDAQGLPR